MKTDTSYSPRKNNTYHFATLLLKRDFFLFLSIFLFLTVSGFGQWKVLTPPIDVPSYQSYKKIAIVDSYKWLLSDTEVFKTTDDGQTWSKSNLGINANDIHFVNKDTGFVAGDYDQLSKTVRSCIK